MDISYTDFDNQDFTTDKAGLKQIIKTNFFFKLNKLVYNEDDKVILLQPDRNVTNGMKIG